jgi:hypothetical protein
MQHYVKQLVAAEVLGKLAAMINSYNAMIKPDAVVVTDQQKMGVRTMAEGREGYVRLVSKIAMQHEDALSRLDKADELQQRIAYDAALETTRQAAIELLEQLDDTRWGNSADIMVMTDRYLASLQNQRANNSALDQSLREVDDWNSRYGRNAAKEPLPGSEPPAAT